MQTDLFHIHVERVQRSVVIPFRLMKMNTQPMDFTHSDHFLQWKTGRLFSVLASLNHEVPRKTDLSVTLVA